MDDIRLTMELQISSRLQISVRDIKMTYEFMNTMTRITSYDSISFRLDNLLNLVTDITVWNSWFTDCDGLFDRFTGVFDKVERFLIAFADWVGGIQVGM